MQWQHPLKDVKTKQPTHERRLFGCFISVLWLSEEKFSGVLFPLADLMHLPRDLVTTAAHFRTSIRD